MFLQNARTEQYIHITPTGAILFEYNCEGLPVVVSVEVATVNGVRAVWSREEVDRRVDNFHRFGWTPTEDPTAREHTKKEIIA